MTLRGLTTAHLFERMLERLSIISAVELVTFKHIKARGRVAYDSPHVASSRYLSELGAIEIDSLSFWDRVMFSIAAHNGEIDRVTAELLNHNSPIPFRSVLRADFRAENLLASVEGETGLVGISSRITTTDGSIMHIPMLDFHCSVNDQNESNVAKIGRTLAGPGFVIQSGRSYHFIGTTLIEEDQFPIFLGKALLFAPIVDRSWLAHQLIQGSCVLRISAKRKVFPMVSKEVN